MRSLTLGLEALKKNEKAIEEIPSLQGELMSLFNRLHFLFQTIGDMEKQMYYRNEPTFGIFDPNLLK